MNKPLLGLVVAIAGLALVLALRGNKEERPAPAKADRTAPASPGAGRQPAEAVLAISPSVLAARPEVAKPKRSPLIEEFESKRDRKAMYDRLAGLASRTGEENYVLAEILNTCRHAAAYKGEPVEGLIEQARKQATAGLSPKDPMRERRLAAYDAIYAGTGVCKGFRDVTITKERVRELMEAGARAGDARAQARLIELDIWAPLAKFENDPVQMVRRESMPSMSEAQLLALQQAVATNDPAVLMVAARLFGTSMGDLQVRAGPDERAVDIQAFHDAWVLAACDAGSDCGPAHEMILGGCYAMGNCDAGNLRDYLFFYMNSPQRSQLVAQYQAQIQRAIQARDWSYFQFHRGPPAVGTMAMHPPP